MDTPQTNSTTTGTSSLHNVEIEAEGDIADCWYCMDVEVYLLHGYPIRFDA